MVVGAGFGGLNVALSLARRPDIDLTVIDTHNRHLFQPLLYQVATAALAATDIASPVRGILPASSRARVLTQTVTSIDTARRVVSCGDHRVPYDELVVATGSEPSYFGHDDWAKSAPGLKSLEDALQLRARILAAFQRASVAAGEERRRQLTFVLIGGGPTGVEMAGSIAELARDLLAHDYDMPGAGARIILVEAGSRVLPEFTPDLSDKGAAALRDLGVEIRSGTRVTGIEDGVVHVHDGTIAAGTIVWTAGTAATPVAKWLGVKPGHGGRVPVEADLSLAGHPDIHVIGDAALAIDERGKPFPGLASVAKQQGRYVARRVLGRSRTPFRYRNYGSLAAIGRGRAVAEFGDIHLSGEIAWGVWALAHIFFLIGFRNRVLVAAQWSLSYAINRRTDLIGRPSVAKPGYSVMPPSTNGVAPVT